jgi:hypothetical protein
MKTVEDYMQDDDIQNMPEYLREIHAVRRVIADEIAGMTIEETNEYLREKTGKAFADLGLPPPQYADLSGQGRIIYDRLEVATN